MNTKTFALLFLSLLSIHLLAQEPVKQIYHERAFASRNANNDPVYLLDNIIQNNDQFRNIDVNKIGGVSVISPRKYDLDSLINLYGPDARNGILSIYSKEFVAGKWYADFALKNKSIASLIEDPKFDYRDYKIYLNKELLETDFFTGLDKKMESRKVKNIRFKIAESDGIKGVIFIKTKPNG